LGQMMAADYLQALSQDQLKQVLIAQLPDILAKSGITLNMLTSELGLSAQKPKSPIQTNNATGQYENPTRDNRGTNKTHH